MNNNILKQYSAPIQSIESSSDVGRISTTTGSYDISHTTKIENEKYRMVVNYSDGKVAVIKITTPEAYFSLYDGVDEKQFCYRVSSGSELDKKGIGLFVVSDYNTEPMDINKFCSLKQRFSRFVRNIRTTSVKLNRDSLFDDSTIIWLEKHGLYEDFLNVQALLDSLSELLLGNQVTEKQLVNLMETGELFRSEKERQAYADKVVELQKEVNLLDKKLEASSELENSLKYQLDTAREEKKSIESDKKSLYANFINDRER